MKIVEAENLALQLEKMLGCKGVVGYKIARNFRMINEELKDYFRFKADLFKKYGVQNGNSLVIDKGSENYPLFVEEIKPLEDQEVNFDFRKFTEEELENSDLSAEQMLVIIENFMEE